MVSLGESFRESKRIKLLHAPEDFPALRNSSFVDISQKQDLLNQHPSDKILVSNLDAFDGFVNRMRRSERREGDSPFNHAFWSELRMSLQLAAPLGFNEPKTDGIYQLKTRQDARRVSTMHRTLKHLTPISPARMADRTGLPVDIVLTELFYANQVGLVDMLWAPNCERCGGSVCESRQLGEMPHEAECVGCGHNNPCTDLDEIKVFFIFDSEVLYFPSSSLECACSSYRTSKMLFKGAAFPTKRSKSGFSYQFGMGGTESEPELAKGLYRIYCPFSGADCYLRVEDDATEKDVPVVAALSVSEMLRPQTGKKLQKFTVPHGKVRFDMLCDTGSVLLPLFLPDMDDEAMFRVPEEQRKGYTSATTCVHHPSFKSLFERQLVSDMSSFTIKRVVFVFTDVVGSTALYEKYGDAAALSIVKQHFKVLFTAFSTSGRIVKTVGDSVMAAYTCGEAAIRAVARGLEQMQKHCLLSDEKSMAIRVGIHSGPALMVALNGINDYFGSTVNVAARIEGKAEAFECLVTNSTLSEPGASEAFDELTTTGGFTHSRDVDLSLKGVDTRVSVKGFQLLSRRSG